MILDRLGVRNFKKLTIVASKLYPVMDNRSLFETRWDHQMNENDVILSLFPKTTQLRTAVTLCLLNRFQSFWYLWCLTRAETPENSIYNRILWVLPTHRVANVKRISGKSQSWVIFRKTDKNVTIFDNLVISPGFKHWSVIYHRLQFWGYYGYFF